MEENDDGKLTFTPREELVFSGTALWMITWFVIGVAVTIHAIYTGTFVFSPTADNPEYVTYPFLAAMAPLGIVVLGFIGVGIRWFVGLYSELVRDTIGAARELLGGAR